MVGGVLLLVCIIGIAGYNQRRGSERKALKILMEKHKHILKSKNCGKLGRIFFTNKKRTWVTNFFFKDNVICSALLMTKPSQPSSMPSSATPRALIRFLMRFGFSARGTMGAYWNSLATDLGLISNLSSDMSMFWNELFLIIFTVITTENGLQLVGMRSSKSLTKQLKALHIFTFMQCSPFIEVSPYNSLVIWGVVQLLINTYKASSFHDMGFTIKTSLHL